VDNKLEKTVQNEIIKKYGTRTDMRLWRFNVGAVQFDNPDRFVRFAIPGFSDLHGILPGGRALYIECKRSHGGRQSDVQKNFQNTAESFGAIYILASSVEAVDKILLPILDRRKQQKHNRAIMEIHNGTYESDPNESAEQKREDE